MTEILRCPTCGKTVSRHCKSPTCSWWACQREVAAGETAGCGSYGYDAFTYIDGRTNKRGDR